MGNGNEVRTESDIEAQRLFDTITEAIASGIRQVDASIDLAVAKVPEGVRNEVAREIYEGWGRHQSLFQRAWKQGLDRKTRETLNTIVGGVMASIEGQGDANKASVMNETTALS